MGGEDAEALECTHALLVAKDRRTGALSATGVKSRAVDDYGVKWTAGLLRHLGYRRLIFQSDGEPAICALKNAATVNLPSVEIELRE
eukprot:2857612-Heterocapsa_arctica.AAC.1